MIAHRDKEGMSELLVPEGCATQSRDHRISQTPLRDFPQKMPEGTARLEERFYNPRVLIDDDIAMVWAHYDFLVDGEVHHWGTNILSLLKQDGQWRLRRHRQWPYRPSADKLGSQLKTSASTTCSPKPKAPDHPAHEPSTAGSAMELRVYPAHRNRGCNSEGVAVSGGWMRHVRRSWRIAVCLARSSLGSRAPPRARADRAGRRRKPPGA
jgi:hypothetical protein